LLSYNGVRVAEVSVHVLCRRHNLEVSTKTSICVDDKHTG
jgi:hypothetical protein